MSVHAVSVWSFTAEHDRATLVHASQLLECMSGPDSPLFLSEFPRYLSVSLPSTPPFSITWSDSLFAVALLSPCPHHLVLSQSGLASTVPRLYNSSPLQHTSPREFLSTLTDTVTHTHTHAFSYWHTFRWSLFPIHHSTLHRRTLAFVL